MAYQVLETCLLVPGIGVDACAAWVQAWGSVLAIVAAILVARHQSKVSQRQVRDSQLQKIEDTFGPPIAIIGAAIQCFEMSMKPTLEERRKGTDCDLSDVDRATIEGLVTALGEFPAHTLGDPGAVQALLRARAYLSTAAEQGLYEIKWAFAKGERGSRTGVDEFLANVDKLRDENQILNAVRQATGRIALGHPSKSGSSGTTTA